MITINEVKELRAFFLEGQKYHKALQRIDGAVAYLIAKIPEKDRKRILNEVRSINGDDVGENGESEKIIQLVTPADVPHSVNA